MVIRCGGMLVSDINLMTPLLGHLRALSLRVGHRHLFGHLLTVLLGHIVTLVGVSMTRADLLIGRAAYLQCDWSIQ